MTTIRPDPDPDSPLTLLTCDLKKYFLSLLQSGMSGSLIAFLKYTSTWKTRQAEKTNAEWFKAILTPKKA